MWIIYALTAAVFYASATMFAKYSVSKVVRDQKGLVLLHAAIAFALTGFLWVINGMPSLGSVHDMWLSLTAGLLIGFAAIFYFKAFHIEDASVVTLLTQVIVPMTLVAGVVFLHDAVGPLQLVASGLILVGVTFAVWSRKGFHLRNKKVIPIMMLATITTSAVLVLSKAIVDHNNIIAYTYYQTLGYIIFGVFFTILNPSTFKGFKKNLRPFHPKMLLIITVSEVLYTLAMLAQLKGFTYVNAGLVISVGASEVFLSILIGYVLTRLFPHLINEKIDKKTVTRKSIAGVLVTTGIVMLNFVS